MKFEHLLATEKLAEEKTRNFILIDSLSSTARSRFQTRLFDIIELNHG